MRKFQQKFQQKLIALSDAFLMIVISNSLKVFSVIFLEVWKLTFPRMSVIWPRKKQNIVPAQNIVTNTVKLRCILPQNVAQFLRQNKFKSIDWSLCVIYTFISSEMYTKSV